MQEPGLLDQESESEPPSPTGFLQERKRGWMRWLQPFKAPPHRSKLLPVLIKVYAAFSKLDGEIAEDEIESSLSFLRYDYPEAIYSEMVQLYRAALREQQDLNEIASQLASELSIDDKILLAAQLYLLIARSSAVEQEMSTFHRFMTLLGVASEARDIIHQLSDVDGPDQGKAAMEQLLESLEICSEEPADLVLEQLTKDHKLSVFRFRGLIILKNTGAAIVIARGHQLRPGQFMRLYEGQRVLLGDAVLDYQDLAFYLNAKKGVSSTQLYLSIGSADNPFVEKVRTKLSVFRIRFGLGIDVEALRESRILVAGHRLAPGKVLRVRLHEAISFPDRSEMTFSELRRRARELGGRFDLNPSKNEYLISNNPGLLRPGDILLSPSMRSEILLRIRCFYEEKRGELEVLRAERSVMVDRQPVRDRAELHDGALIVLGEGQYLRCHFADRIIEEERNIIRQIEIQGLSHEFSQKLPALDTITFSVRRGEMICVMGPSGCGKSSLMRVLAGHLQPTHGRVLMNGISLYENRSQIVPYISYIPHEDAFDALLTVEENLRYAATLRSPHLNPDDLGRRVRAKLLELGLNERRARLAGQPEEKKLSGGERKRLNIGMDMITPADVFLFDEPTSGLSSKDSEHILEIIRGLAHNKIVFVTIHQPSARLFHLFNKALLLDNGGKMVFFGNPQEMLDYFQAAHTEELARPSAEGDTPAADFTQPESIFDVLEFPLRDVGGDIIYEKDTRGHMAPARRFSPNFWRDRFQTYSVLREVTEARLRPETEADASVPQSRAPEKPPRPVKDRGRVLGVMMKRAFLSKLRNRANLAATVLEAPLLAFLIAWTLRFAEAKKNGISTVVDYDFAAAFHIPSYLFLTLVVGMFLGLTNSADEIIRDKVLLQRERNYNLNVVGYIMAKMLALGVVSLIQCVIYLLIGNAILEIRDMFTQYLFWMFLTTLCGASIGLLISSLVRDAKTAINIIPLVLIPQIILGGALIKYEEMNRNLDLAYNLRRWMGGKEEASQQSKLVVPTICEFMPLRWSYESLVLSQDKLNPFTAAQDELGERRDALAQQYSLIKTLSPEQEKALWAVKEAIPKLGATERSPAHIKRRIDRLLDEVRNGTFDPKNYSDRGDVDPEKLYVNEKVRDLVTKAEIEYAAPKHKGNRPNVFFGKQKRYYGNTVDTLVANGIVLLLFTLLPLLILYVSLRRQLHRV